MTSSDRTHQTGQLVDQIFDLKRMLGQFGRLIEISLQLNAMLDPEELLAFIIQSATEILECQAVSVLLYDDEENRLRFAASTDLNKDELWDIPVPLNSSVAGMIFQTNRPELINDALSDPRIFKPVGETASLTTRNLIGAPMNIGERTAGVIEAVNKKDGNFTKEELDLLIVIGSQAAVAINNAQLMQSLQKAYNELSNVDKVKSDFIAIASHELRTPLNIILGYSEFLKEDASGEMSGHADRVLNAAQQLRSLIEDMTNMNLLQSGTQGMEAEVIPIQQIVYDAYQDVKVTADTKNLRVVRHYQKEPLPVKVDREMLKQVCVNVFNNAIRFSEQNADIDVTVKGQKEFAHVSIQDHGIGIPTDELEKIFDDFYQVEDHRTRRYGGMGLGLSIARGITHLHQGRIWAESEGPGRGSTFHILIPLVDEKAQST
jgi:signal transduction histidine kinase